MAGGRNWNLRAMTTSPPDRSPGITRGSEEPPAQARGLRGRLSGSWRKFWGLLTGGAHSPLQTSVAFGFGVVVSLLIPPPFQTPAALGIALLLRLNSLVTLSGTLLCQPFTLPFIVLLEHRVGRWVLPHPVTAQPGGVWNPWVKPVLVGAPIIALAAGALATAICYLALRAWGAVRPDPKSPQDPAP